MDEMNDKIGAILNDPNMMQQIMSMAQAIGGSTSQEQGKTERPAEQGLPELDLATVQKLTGLARQTRIDNREQALLGALAAYLSKERIGKLEKAMRAAKMARLASATLGQKGLLFPTGR